MLKKKPLVNFSNMLTHLKRQAKRLEDELTLVDHPSGLATYEMAFMRLYAQGFKPFEAMVIIADNIEEWVDFTDLQIKNQALKVLKKPVAKAYLKKLTDKLEELGVASMLEMQMFLTDAIRTPIGMIDDDSPLCQKKTVVKRTVTQKDGSVVETETVTLESINKMDAGKTLIKMKGWDAPVKIDVNHSGGVMLIPMAANLLDWEKAAQDSQAKLMKDAIDI